MEQYFKILNWDNLQTAILPISLCAPGFLIMLLRSQFITGRIPNIASASMEYVIITSLYYSLTVPTFIYVGEYNPLTLFLLVFLGPIIVGLVFGVIYQKGFMKYVYNFTHIHPIHHPAPTAWDYLFGSTRKGCWIIVTLKSSEPIFGYFGTESFASSDLEKRDIYIEKVLDDKWNVIGTDDYQRGIWIHEDEILSVEIIK
ncbi:DUF6338 family protein [Parasulfitobacter algicola]|uniref:Uncharacterized protein n=1 Tax=Parasulfitobacter algicola TaxID=2614809 RepID=A0ABX2IN47_9RHOB|nr:hypothetical protein [Sulfitobacter algicola]